MKNKEPIGNYMTYSPHTVNSDLPIEAAHKMMKKFNVRHLPVQSGAHLVGIVSERDLLLARTLDRDGNLLVDNIMITEPYTVSKDAPLGDVVEAMATNLYGCAIVCDERGHVIGIFTAIDGLREISDRLNIKSRKAAIGKGATV